MHQLHDTCILIVLMVQKSGEHHWKVNVNRDLLQKRQYSRSHSHWNFIRSHQWKGVFFCNRSDFYIILLYPTTHEKCYPTTGSNHPFVHLPMSKSTRNARPFGFPLHHRLHGLLKGLLGIHSPGSRLGSPPPGSQWIFRI